MNFLSSLAKSVQSSDEEPKKTAGEEPKKTAGEEAAPSTTGLFSSAKLVAEAAQNQFSGKTSTEDDNKKVAGAAADLLEAAQTYGKLDETQGVGSYIEKAENYLHQYSNPTTTTAPAAVPVPSAEAPDSEVKAPPPAAAATPESEVKAPPPAAVEEAEPPTAAAVVESEEKKAPAVEAPAPASEEKSGIEGEFSQYAKVAEGYLKSGDEAPAKASEGEGEGGGYGGFLKSAGDFLGKK